MSTKLYCFRVKKSEFWDILTTIRKFYASNHPLVSSLLSDKYKYDVEKFHALNADFLNTDFQLFDEGETWIIRVLEAGWFFWNNHEKFPTLTPIVYDTRSDDEDEDNEELMAEKERLANWVDAQISEMKYFCCPIVNKSDIESKIWKRMVLSKERTREMLETISIN